jgi:hypothetical protein
MRQKTTNAGGRCVQSVPATILAGFRKLAQLRQGRAFHPRGLLLSGQLSGHGNGLLPLPTGPGDVLARVSKGAGVPGGGPDVLGLALRLPSDNLPCPAEGPWDILLSTAGTGALTRMLPRPAATWHRATYSTIEPYRAEGRHVWLLARPAGHPTGPASIEALQDWVRREPLRFTLHESGHDRRWRQVAEVTLSRPLPENDEDPAFNPMTHIPPDVRLAPEWLSRLRELAYRGSRIGRRCEHR